MTKMPEGAARFGLVDRMHRRAGHTAAAFLNLLRPRLSLGVRLMAFDEEGRVFLVRHSYLPGMHLPGGAVDAGESCREAAEREAREEGGLVIAGTPAFFHVYCNPAGGRDHCVLFTVRGASQPRPWPPSLEIREAGFHRIEALPDNLTSGTARRIAEVVDGRPPSDVW